MADTNSRTWLEIQDDALYLFKDNETIWKVLIADLILVGEYTTEGGPWAEDYYFVFGAGRPPRFYEVPLWMGNPILSALSAKLGSMLVPVSFNEEKGRKAVAPRQNPGLN